MYTAIDKSKDIHIDSEGRLLDWRLRRIVPDLDEDGYLFFYLPSPSGTQDKRYVHVEVVRHHGDPVARSSGPGQIGPDEVTFKDKDKGNVSVSNLVYEPASVQAKAKNKPDPPPADPEPKAEVEAETKEDSEGEASPPPSVDVAAQAEFDFATIKGIGATMNQRLHENGVHTVADFTSADPEPLAKQLKVIPAKLKNIQDRVAKEYQ